MTTGSPRRAAYFVATIVALSFSYDLLRTPVQVSDSLLELLDVQESPSLYSTFVTNTQHTAYLRPLRLVQIKALFDAADGHYWLVYRGFHALLLTAMVLLFTRALQVRTWTDFAAASLSLTVLTGLHTFRGTVREAFPINHFLEIVVFCLIALNLARSRGGWWVDAAAALTFVIASLILESGLLVWVVVVAAWASGMRGVSRRGVVVMTTLMGLYFLTRFMVLSVGAPGLTERGSGYGIAMLEPEELEQRFGANPMSFYVYNVATSVLSVLFSDPDGGVFMIARTWLQGDVPPRLYVAFASSTLTTAIIVWLLVRVFRKRDVPLHDTRILVIFTAVLAANAALSYAYTKPEILAVAGAFYALAVFAATRCGIDYARSSVPAAARIALCLTLAAAAPIWAFRSAGVHHMLRNQAFKERNDWARVSDTVYQQEDWSIERRETATQLVRQLRQSALEMPVTNPHLLPRWTDRWWGE